MKTLLIAQGMDELRAALEESLSGYYQVSTCSDGQTALELLHSLKPDILILDLMLPELDGISVLKRAAPDIPPAVLATTRFASDYVLQSIQDLGVGYLMMLPCSVSAVVDRVADLVQHQSQPPAERLTPQILVSAQLSTLGVPVKLDGFKQLCIAIPLYAQDPLQSLTKELYPSVAKLCGCGDGRQVERSIRKAIHTAWAQRDDAVWATFFPTSPEGYVPRPSNKAFISSLANALTYRMSAQG